MTNTVTVRVDRTVKHPVYRKYIKKRKKFMAHDDLGARIGDKVKIVSSRGDFTGKGAADGALMKMGPLPPAATVV